MARFWNQLDKADISVPLVFTKYSDVSEMQHLHLQQPARKQPYAVAIETQPHHSDGSSKAPKDEPGSVMRQDFKHWKVRPEPSCKPKNEYHCPEVPFDNETQYQKDFKPWPVPKRDHPWIPKPQERSKCTAAEVDTGVEKSEIADKVQEKEILSSERKKQAKKVTVVSENKPRGEEGEGRAAADALNRQIKKEVTCGSSYR